jgi:cysteine-rich repeat protein
MYLPNRTCTRWATTLRAAVVVFLCPIALNAATTERASVSSTGVEGLAASSRASISANGRYVAFYSDANNLVPGDTNGVRDVFVRDRSTGDTVRVSINSAGMQGDGKSDRPSISADGRFVAFTSDATNLAGTDLNGQKDIFVHDRDTDVDGIFDEPGTIATTLVSVSNTGGESNGRNNLPAISADGRYVAFRSRATNMVAVPTSGVDHIFVRDRTQGTTVLVSLSSSGTEGDADSDRPAISPNGRFIAFHSDAGNLVVGDVPTFDAATCPLCTGVRDAFVHDRDPDGNGVLDEGNGTTDRVSVASDETPGNSASSRPNLSEDGRYVVFKSSSNNLVAGDTNASDDVFVRDRLLGTTVRLSISPTGEQAEASGPDSVRASVSNDGQHIAFASDADDLVPGDTNLATDVFVRDVQLGTTIRVSVGAGGVEGNGLSNRPSISGDGRFIAFYSDAFNLVVGDSAPFDAVICPACVGVRDIFLYDRDPDLNGIFDEGNAVTTRLSVATDGTPANGNCTRPAISDDGLHVSFRSTADNLVIGDTNGLQDVFVRDIANARTVRISLSSAQAQGIDGNSDESAISGDGRFVAFWSKASGFVAGDSAPFDSVTCPACVGRADIFLRDRDPDMNGIYDEGNETTIRVSVSSGGVAGDQDSFRPEISSDGRYVGFISEATNLVASDTNGRTDVFVYEIATGTTTRVSLGTGGIQGNYGSDRVTLSSDGRFVGFRSKADNLVAGDEPSLDADTCPTCLGWRDVFLRDRDPDMNGIFDESSATTIRVSLSSAGIPGDRETGGPKLAGDASAIAMVGPASNLVASDTNYAEDVFLRNLGANTTQRVSVSSTGSQATTPDQFPADSDDATISIDGRFVAFRSTGVNLVGRDTNLLADVFLHDRDVDGDGFFDESGAVDTIRLSVDNADIEAKGASGGAKISADRSTIAFYSDATNLIPNDNNLVRDVFFRVLSVCGNGVPEGLEECDDGNQTTGDGCEPTCVFTPGECTLSTQCDDGDLCTTDICNQTTGLCVNTLKDCQTADLCMIGSCNSATGSCQLTPVQCAPDEFCIDGTCSAGCAVAADCNDAIDCTIDSCDTIAGNLVCVHTPDDTVCDTGLFCAAKVCDQQLGCVFDHECFSSTGNPCPDSATCDEGTGSCGGCFAPQVEAVGGRYLRVTPADQGATPVAILVTGSCNDPDVPCVSQYAQSVCLAGLNDGLACVSDADCPKTCTTGPLVGQPCFDVNSCQGGACEGFCNAGLLGDGPVFLTSGQWGATPVRGVNIRPSATYVVHAVCDFGGTIVVSEGIKGTTWRWGDTSGNTVVNVIDITVTVDAVKLLFSEFVTFEGANIFPCIIDERLNVLDVTSTVDAVKSVAYACPSACPN